MKTVRKTPVRGASKRLRKYLSILTLAIIFLSVVQLIMAAEEGRQGNALTKLRDLRERETAVRKEEERLNALKKDVDNKIGEYKALLDKIEKQLSKLEQVNDEKLSHAVRAYEAMPPEDAAARLSVIDETTAVSIIMQMKAKKAGAVISFMEPKKAASITKSMTGIVKNFPTN